LSISLADLAAHSSPDEVLGMDTQVVPVRCLSRQQFVCRCEQKAGLYL
jgi:hypothetical protein